MIGRALKRREAKSALEDWPWSSAPPDSWLLGGSAVSAETAIGLPALLSVLLRVGTGVGMIPQKVYKGRALNRSEALDAWQYELLHDAPTPELPAAVFRGNIALQMASAGRAYVRKYKGSSGQVRELHVLDGRKVTPKRSGGRLVFEDRTGGGQTVVRDQSDIIFIPTMSLDGGFKGISPITAARTAIDLGLKRQSFAQRFFDKNAQPGAILSFPERMEEDTARRWVDLWDEGHQGVENWHATAAIGGGATVTTVPISMADAQWVEANRLTGEQMGGMYAIPKPFLNLGDNSPTQDDWKFMVTFGLGPYTTSIDQAFNADRDLFPQGSGLKVEHLTDALLKADQKSRYEAYKAARQAGWLTANEIRALENYPPDARGDELQATPVGGAPNPSGEPDAPA